MASTAIDLGRVGEVVQPGDRGMAQAGGAVRPEVGPAAAVGASPAARWLVLAGALGAVYVIWGSTYLAIAIALESFPPLLLMGVRSMVAGGVLYGGARSAGAPRPDGGAWRNAGEVGLLFFLAGHGLLAWGETRVPSGAAAVIIATEPLFIVLLGWLAGRRLNGRPAARPTRAVGVALALGLAGVAVLTLPARGGGLDPLGVLALVAASLAWSVGTFRVRPHGSPVLAAGMQLLVGGTALCALALPLGEFARWSALPLHPDALLALLYLVAFGSVITFTAYIWLLRELGAARVASHTYVNPVIAVGLGGLLYGEPFGVRTLLASLMILTAVVLLTRRRV